MTQATPHQRDLAGESWNPGQYLKFADHRLRPALDLMGRIPLEDPQVIYDLGCGSGNVTRLLADRWRDADVVGMDNSPEMLERAAADADGYGGNVRWQTGDLANWQPDREPSVLYSNAVIQWVPDHDELVPRLWDLLPPGGCLAVQAPLSWDMRSHHLMREALADGGPDGRALGSRELRTAVGNRWVQDPRFLLRPAGSAVGAPGRVDDGVPARADRRRRGAGVGDGARVCGQSSTAWTTASGRFTWRIPASAQRGVSQTSRRRYAVSVPAGYFS